MYFLHIYIFIYTHIYSVYFYVHYTHTCKCVWGSNKCIQKDLDTHKSLTVTAYGKEPQMGK